MGSGPGPFANGHLEGSFRPNDLPVVRQERGYLSDRLIGAHALRPAGCRARAKLRGADQAAGEAVFFHQGGTASETPGARPVLCPRGRSDRGTGAPRELELSVPHGTVG